MSEDNTAPEAKHTITEKDRKAIAQSSREQFGYQPPDHLEAAIFNNAAEWGIKYARQEVAELRKENERLRNDLLDALDLKKGNGPTALSMQAETIKRLTEALEETKREVNGLTMFHNDFKKINAIIDSALSGTKETE